MKCGICQSEMEALPSVSEININSCISHDHNYTYGLNVDDLTYVYTILKKIDNTSWLITYASLTNSFSILYYKKSVPISLISRMFENVIVIPAQKNDPLFALSLLDKILKLNGFL